jgi:NAD(P)-dependent dehydrogenase (short-subunit alcohol dehydrogenase family)
MLLENKNAVIYGGGGEIGGVVARAFVGRGGQCGGPYGFRPRRLDDRDGRQHELRPNRGLEMIRSGIHNKIN